MLAVKPSTDTAHALTHTACVLSDAPYRHRFSPCATVAVFHPRKSCASSTLARTHACARVMGITFALFLLCAATASASPRLQVASRPSVRNCVAPGRDQPLATVYAKCPCLVRFRATNTVPSNTILSFLVTRKQDYEAWKRSGFVGTPRLERRFSFNAVRLDRYVEPLDKFGFNTLPLYLNATADVVLTIRSSSQSPDCTLSVQYIFRPLPETCPLRLPPPPPPPAALPRRAVVRIVEGAPVTEPEHVAFNVLLLAPNGRKCTGSLIAGRWVLTAAHCEIRRGLALIGGTGTHNGEQITIVRAVPHPQFLRSLTRTASRLENDISLIKLATRAHGEPVSLNSNADAPDPGTFVRASGYGLLFERWPSDVLHAVDLPVLGLDACRDRFRNAHAVAVANGVDDDAHLCVGRDSRCQGGICEGDSGGPLVARGPDGGLVQIGIASFADKLCGNHNTPDVFTRVATYANWIANVTGNAPTFVALSGTNRGASRVAPIAHGAGLQLSSVAKSLLVGLGAGFAVLIVAFLIAIPVRNRARSRSRSVSSEAPSIPPDIDDLFPPPPAWRPASADVPRTKRRSLAALAPGQPRRNRRSLDPAFIDYAFALKRPRFIDR